MFSCPSARDHSLSQLIGRLPVYGSTKNHETILIKVH